MNQDTKKQLVAEAKRIARQVDSWIGLSNAISDPEGGLIARYFPDAEERQAFLRSAEYEELDQLLKNLKLRRLLDKAASRLEGSAGSQFPQHVKSRSDRQEQAPQEQQPTHSPSIKSEDAQVPLGNRPDTKCDICADRVLADVLPE